MNLRQVTFGAIIAAVYAALTLVLSPISMGAVQCRISEALTILPLFTPVAIPGLFIGCLIANVFLGSVYDIVFGSLTTLLAAFLTWKCRKNKYIAMLFPVVLNAVIVGGYIGLFLDNSMAVWLCMAMVGLGQAVACYGLGLPLYKILKKLFRKEEL
ncbi:MAG: QueT transporter family protein [Clostridia bacterium]|nr:QueT transporter family protein [Oscillospiraceae bacterium]MBQ7033649.1 QueT transporter family protein [Clostridia bacterium]